ncbi:hypothetical protein [Chromobacterium violaceum]|uniref:hypothetical protein n=1 Tax=Chromobacterium violaceum TaxID=536 RepID=UPI001E2EB437|nr:hypothetical protein [Chromobacterium violaceum]
MCKSYQNWRQRIPFSNMGVALVTSLISVAGIVVPHIYKVVHEPRSEATLMMPSVDGTTLRVVAVNRGDAPASLAKAWVVSQYLAPATKVRLRNDSEAIINPGSQLITFDIIPLLSEDESHSDSLEVLGNVINKKPSPRTEVRFHVMQSDGRYSVQAIPLDFEQLLALLRANADRCSTIKTANFENGCIGRGDQSK